MNMLTQFAVAHYLLERDVISPEILVDGDLSVLDFTRRNTNFKVVSRQGPGFLLKQGVDDERRVMLAHEADVYGLLHSRAAGKRLRRYMPRLHLYHAEECTLVFELLREAETLEEY